MGPLEGIRVIDWTFFQQGPVASAMLGDLGADVIKLEDPVNGDPGRTLGRVGGQDTGLPGGRNYYFEDKNRNKRGLTLDLKKPHGREVLYKLVKTSDVLVQNLRLGVAEKLGADYQTLCRHNPRLIYAHATGYGREGPDARESSSDYAGIARTGFMTMVGEDGADPPPFSAGICDQIGAIMLAYGVLGALFVRERTGQGQEVDCSLLGAMMQLQANALASHLFGRAQPRAPRTRARNQLWNHYKCGDGRWLAVSCLQPDRYWSPFCRALGISSLEHDPKYADRLARDQNAAELIAIIDPIFLRRPRDEWLRLLKGQDIPCSPVNRLSDLASDPQYVANHYIVDFDHPALGKIKVPGIPVEFSQTPGGIRRPAPEFGEHTEEILLELGYTWDDLAHFRTEGII
ncbi:MAG: CoA transferase [Chloroflexi bacterium]|nr:CoA transferase [Chloroflexota bacterium]